MPRIDRHMITTSGGAFGPRHTIGALLISVALIAPAPALAQSTDNTAPPDETQTQSDTQTIDAKVDEVLELTSNALAHLIEDELAQVSAPLERAMELAQDPALPPAVRAFPLVVTAHLARLDHDWAALNQDATEFETALINAGFADHGFRVEASVLRGIALFHTGDTTEAERIFRDSLPLYDGLDSGFSAQEMTRYYLALAATKNGAADAAELREDLLNDGVSQGYIVEAQLHYLRYPDVLLGVDLPGGVAKAKLSEDQIYDLADAGLDLGEIGDYDGAFTLLSLANDVTYENDYPILVDHYPNLAFARYSYLRDNWSEVQRFAASVASALDKEETADHPYRIEATILQGVALFETGRNSEAEVLLRGAMADSDGFEDMIDLNELAHYFLARAATKATATDASELRESFMARFTGDYLVTNSQALFLLYLSLNAVVDAGESPEMLIEQSEQLIALADSVEGVDPIYRSFFRGNHGQLLYQAGRYEDAMGYFKDRRAYLLEEDNIANDFAVVALRLGNALARTVGTDESRASMLADLERLRARGQVDDWALSDLLAQIAFTYRWQDDEANFQKWMRDAYSEMRRKRRVTNARVKSFAGYIDPNDPGMVGFPLAAEFGVIDETAFTLKSSGEDTIRMFLEGNYAGLERLLDAYAEKGKDETPEYLVNLALYKAMLGAYQDSQDALSEARRKARTTNGSMIPANAAIFDLIDLVSKVWGTTHLSDKADGAIARLQVRESTLPHDQLSLYLVLRALAKYQSGQDANIRSDLRRWIDAQPDTRDDPPSVIEQWTYALAAEMIYVYFGAEEGDAWIERMLAWVDHPDGAPLTLVRDTIQMTRTFSSPTVSSTDLALSEMSGLASVILDQVPRNHALVAATQFNVANAFWSRGQYETALTWMQGATDAWRANPYHRKDTLAFLVSRQSSLMLQTGQIDLAATMAREAYDMIDPLTSRGDLAAGVILTYAYAIRSRNDDAEMGGAVLKKHVEDPAFMQRLPARDAIYMHQSYADMLANYAEIDVVLEQLRLADDAVPNDDGLDWRQDQSQVAMTRAIAIYWAKDYKDAWSEITRANDIKTAWQRDTIRDGDSSDVSSLDTRNRAAWEAIMGWDYAQTLPPAPPQ